MARITSRFSDRRVAPNGDHRANRRSVLVLHHIRVRGRRTSIRLEPQIWMILAEICRRERCTTEDVCSYVASLKHGSLASSLRVFMLDYFRAAATDDGHRNAGHGQGMFMLKRQERRKRRAKRINPRASDGVKRGAPGVLRPDHS
jgi:predicted DNA-binding ribbon-helix-helix protein